MFEESYLEIKTLNYSSSSVRLSDACSLISIWALDDRKLIGKFIPFNFQKNPAKIQSFLKATISDHCFFID